MTELVTAKLPLPITLTYTNWKGKKGLRTVTPKSIYWGSTEYHPERQWLMWAYDHDKKAHRDFALKDMTIETD